MIRNVLKKFGFVAVIAAVGFPFVIATSARAQEPAATPAPSAAGTSGGEATAERVIVTGSNIPTAEEVGPNPVDTYRPEDIQKLGVRTATDLTEKLPADTGGKITENIANGGDGRTEVNLRGIFPKETLVLQDGRRLAVSLFGAALGSQSVDINVIPFQLVDRIEILKDGASAIYGSDAIAGVFNVLLKHRFRGLELGASYGNTNLGASNDAGEEQAWILAGTGDDKTDIVVFAEMYNRAAIFSHDTFLTSDPNYRNFGGGDARSSNFGGSIGSGGPRGFLLLPQFSAPTPHSAPNVTTDTQYVRRGTQKPEFQLFNFADLTPAIPAADREFLYGSFTRDLCDKYLTIFSDFRYTRTFFDSAFAPVPFTPDPFLNSKGLPNGSSGISVPLQNPFNPFTVSNTSTTYFGIPLYTGVKFRGLEAGLRTAKYTTNDYLFDGGLRGELGEFGDYFKTWGWESNFRYDDIFRHELFENAVSKPGLRDALLDTNPATAFNPFINTTRTTPGQPAFVNTKAAQNRVYTDLHHTSDNSLTLEDVKLYGDLFNLPAGAVAFAAGGEHRTERYKDNPDSLNVTFSTIGSTDLQASRGNRDVWAAYGELRLPVTSPTWNFPGLYSLEFTAAERIEYFSDVHPDGPTERPKFEVRYQPFDTALTLRATYNEAFHVPYLNELTGNVAESFPTVFDPYAPPRTSRVPQIRTLVGGNPNLQPEVAYEWSYGLVVTPGKWWSPLEGLTLNADWWHIDMREAVSPFSSTFIVEHCNLFPGRVLRDGSAGPIDPCGQHGELVQVDNTVFNLGGLRQEGLDYGGIYQFDTARLGHGSWGTFTSTVNGTYLARYVFFTKLNPKRIDETGNFLDFGSLPQNRIYASEFYDLGGLDTGITMHYAGQYSDSASARAGSSDRKIREYITFDMLASYNFNLPPPTTSEVAGYSKDGGKNVKMKDGKDKNVAAASTAEYNPCGWRAWLNGTTITLGMNNIFDTPPPFVAGAFENGYDESVASVQGRFWYVELKKRF